MNKEEKNVKTAIPQDEPQNAAETGAQTEAAENGVSTANDYSSYDDVAEFAKEQDERERKIKEDEALPPDPKAILEVRHLKKYFVLKKTLLGKPISQLKAVDDVSLKI
ncbi:MAG: hypothetical protein ACI4SH_08000, partial [Candidatus Scatosoma sp.]